MNTESTLVCSSLDLWETFKEQLFMLAHPILQHIGQKYQQLRMLFETKKGEWRFVVYLSTESAFRNLYLS